MRSRLGCWLVLLVTGCSPQLHYRNQLKEAENKFKDHIGFMLYDPATKKTLLEFNSAKYFTPASNTKAFTFYTALQLLGDSVPALRYTINQDSLIFWGTGDPSFLYINSHQNDKVYRFLSQASQHLYFSSSNFYTDHFGPGWAWDDYYYSYSVERSPFPVFGNFTSFNETPKHDWVLKPYGTVSHLSMNDSIIGETKIIRDIDSNKVKVFPGKKKSSRHSWEIPFRYNQEVLVKILSDTLKRPVEVLNYPLKANSQVLFSVPTDSLLKTMMQSSDNFIAEQLLMMCAGVLSDTLKPEIAIAHANKNFLFDFPDENIWVDGSGLSRYNLFTPRSMVRLWEKIYVKVPRERLFRLLAVGGESGTLKYWYKSKTPFIYGKTGSLSNNHTLSGYLLTQKGRILIFSFMNANFTVPTSDVRREMQEFLTSIRDNY